MVRPGASTAARVWASEVNVDSNFSLLTATSPLGAVQISQSPPSLIVQALAVFPAFSAPAPEEGSCHGRLLPEAVGFTRDGLGLRRGTLSSQGRGQEPELGAHYI
ncbi:hypothetical protein PM082_002462 [Marasmius tenuissimus]|nr:hypothetical protein PM082_002462 [Marasmius tenuissimus]